MFGVPVLDSIKKLWNKKIVVKNLSILASKLNKKQISIAYHSIRWNVADNVVKVAQIYTNYNLADAFMKRLTSEKQDRLFGDWTYYHQIDH